MLAIKQTVYRTSDDSPLVPALIRAAERGKQAVCLVEVKARFDERANIQWGRALEEAGVHVVYGLPSLKTHAKCILVVRREGDGVRHYLHVGTGNYNAKTARLYTDFGLLTCDERDRRRRRRHVQLPHRLRAPARLPQACWSRPRTCARGSSRRSSARSPSTRTAARADPDEDELARRPRVHPGALPRLAGRRAGGDQHPRHLLPEARRARASRENIRVVSVVGRFLEHSRIYAFERDGDCTVYIGSADLMPRNLDTRVELLTPIRDESLRADLVDTLDRCFADNTNAWELDADGDYTAGRRRQRAAQRPARADDRARRRGRRSDPDLKGSDPFRC